MWLYWAQNMRISALNGTFLGENADNTKLDYTALSNVDMVWIYPGHAPRTMGNVDPFEVKWVLL